MPTALITGITGQDGSYLAEFLLAKDYNVIGIVRRSSTTPYERIAHLVDKVELLSADLLDQHSLVDAMAACRPDEIYNLAAQSFVQTSWTQPVLTGEFTGARRDPHARGHAQGGADGALLPGQLQRDVRQGAGDPAARDHDLLSAQPVRRRQGVRALDHGELPRELRPLRGVAASSSITRARAAGSSSSRARSPTPSRASSSDSRRSCASATSRRGATGASPATTSTRCGACCSSRHARGLRDRHRRDVVRAPAVRARLQRRRARLPGIREAGRTLLPAGRGRPARRESREGAARTRLEGRDATSPSSCG